MKKVLLFIFLFFSLLRTATADISDIENILDKAQSAQLQGEFKAALIYLKKGQKKYPKEAYLKIKLAEIYLAVGEGALAEIELNKALDLGVKKSTLQYLLTRSALLQGEVSRVLLSSNSILGLSSQDIAKVRAIQGRAYLQQNNFKKARNLFLQATPGSVCSPPLSLFEPSRL